MIKGLKGPLSNRIRRGKLLFQSLKQGADWQGQLPPLYSSEAYLINAAPVHRYAAWFPVLVDLPVLNAESGEDFHRVTL